MKVGDLVVLSKKGENIRMNSLIMCFCSYGFISKYPTPLNLGLLNVVWFKKDGTPYQDVRHSGYALGDMHYRYELKYLRKKS